MSEEVWNTLASYGINDAYTKDEVDALIPVFPTVVSAFINDVGYLTEHQDISGKQDNLTISQMNAANSGITAELVQLFDTYSTIIMQKQNTLTPQELEALNSGITRDKVALYDSLNFDITNKADKATTLAGYGIIDASTKDDIEQMFETLKNTIEEAID